MTKYCTKKGFVEGIKIEEIQIFQMINRPNQHKDSVSEEGEAQKVTEK